MMKVVCWLLIVILVKINNGGISLNSNIIDTSDAVICNGNIHNFNNNGNGGGGINNTSHNGNGISTAVVGMHNSGGNRDDNTGAVDAHVVVGLLVLLGSYDVCPPSLLVPIGRY